MNEKVSQATVAPSSGASNTKDFQPDTGNPQTAPVNLFQQQGGIQNITNTQELLSDQQNARITVTSEPAQTPPAVAQAKETPVGFISALVIAFLITVVLLVIKIRASRSNSSNAETVSTGEQPEKVEQSTPAEKTTIAKPKAKTSQKRKASKKAKRKRR